MSWLELPRDVWETLLLLLHRPELLALRPSCRSWKESLEASFDRLQPRSIEVEANSRLSDLDSDLAKHNTNGLQTQAQAAALSLYPRVRELDLSNSVGLSTETLQQALGGLPLLQVLTCPGNFSTGNSHLAVIAAFTKIQVGNLASGS